MCNHALTRPEKARVRLTHGKICFIYKVENLQMVVVIHGAGENAVQKCVFR